MQQREDRPEKVRSSGYSDRQGGVGMQQVLLLVACAVLVSVFAVNMLLLPNFASKKDFTANIQGMTEIITKSKTDSEQAIKNIQNTMNALPTSITGQVNTAITQTTSSLSGQISSMQAQVNNTASNMANKTDISNLNSTITSLGAKITALETKVAGLETRIKALEPSTSPSTVGIIPFTVTSRIVNKDYVHNTASTTNLTVVSTTVTFGVKLTLTNGVAKDLEDIELAVPIDIETEYNITYWSESMSHWNLSEKDISGSYAWASLEGDSITLDSSDTKKITIPMTIVIAGNTSTIEIDIDDDDIEVVDWGYA